MARMLPEMCPSAKAGAPLVTAERVLFERLSRELGSGWTVIHDCAVHARGDAGTIEFVLVHGGFGLALLGIAEPGEEADPELAVGAMRTMLAEIGFTRRFRGDLAIVAQTLRADETDDLGDIVDGLFARRAVSTVTDPTWPEWLIGHLAPAAEAKPAVAAPRPRPDTTPAPQLRAPTREEAWRVASPASAGRATTARVVADPPAIAKTPTMQVAPDPRVVSQAARQRSSSLPAMGFAVIVVTLVLTGMALMSHGNGPGPHASAPIPVAPANPPAQTPSQ
jgi:hypothetical protein